MVTPDPERQARGISARVTHLSRLAFLVQFVDLDPGAARGVEDLFVSMVVQSAQRVFACHRDALLGSTHTNLPTKRALLKRESLFSKLDAPGTGWMWRHDTLVAGQANEENQDDTVCTGNFTIRQSESRKWKSRMGILTSFRISSAAECPFT